MKIRKGPEPTKEEMRIERIEMMKKMAPIFEQMKNEDENTTSGDNGNNEKI